MAEMAALGEHHHALYGIDRRDHVRISDRATGLDDRLDPLIDRPLQAIGEREERIGGHHSSREG